MDLIESLVHLVQIAPDNVYLRIFYAFIVFISMIIGGRNMSKFAQCFSNFEQRFMLSGEGKVIAKPELDDCQAEIDSHKDDSINGFLSKFLPELTAQNPLCDIDDSEVEILNELVGTRADRILAAYEGLYSLRRKYNVPDHYSDEELIIYIQSLNKSSEGGVSDEVQKDESQSE